MGQGTEIRRLSRVQNSIILNNFQNGSVIIRKGSYFKKESILPLKVSLVLASLVLCVSVLTLSVHAWILYFLPNLKTAVNFVTIGIT